jgi:hypothetical protein
MAATGEPAKPGGDGRVVMDQSAPARLVAGRCQRRRSRPAALEKAAVGRAKLHLVYAAGPGQPWPTSIG